MDRIKHLTTILLLLATNLVAGTTRWPEITAQPQPVTVEVGRLARFEVEATGSQPLHYQWFRGNVVIRGATHPVYRHYANPEDNGVLYGCVVWNEWWQPAISAWVPLTVAGQTPTPTPLPTATTTPTPEPTTTASATPSPTPTITVTPAAVKRPHGIIELISDSAARTEKSTCWTNAAIDGVRVRTAWNVIQPDEETRYDWSMLDAAVASAVKFHKQIGLSISSMAESDTGADGKVITALPAWLAPQVRLYSLPATGSGHTRVIALPWDSVWQEKWLSFVRVLGQRYDGKLDYIAMGGLGAIIESYITHDPADIDLSLDEGLRLWSQAVNAIIEAHVAAFKVTPFIFTAAKPFDGGDEALKTVVGGAARKYPGRFGIMDCSLNAISSTGYVPHALVSQYSETNPVGLQFLTSADKPFGGHDLGGTLAQALDAAVALHAQYIEVYPIDADNSKNAQLLKDTSGRLAQ